MIRFLVIRYRKSYAYKAKPEAPGSFDNNWKNNSLDWFCILDGGKELARFHCQTVANYNFGAYATADTVEHGDTTVPDPIAEDGTAVVTMQNGVVSMPFWYWQDITIYFIKSQSAEDQYKFLQKVYLQR